MRGMTKKRRLIALALTLIVIGALLGREYPRAGLVVVASVLGIYILAGAQRTWRLIRNFRREDWIGRSRALIAGCFAAVFLGILIGGEVSYFPILLLFCVELLMPGDRG